MGRVFREAHNLVSISPQLTLLGDAELIKHDGGQRASGTYFTPTPLVRALVEQALQPHLLERPRLKILDAACGSGEFLREAIRLAINLD